MSEELTIDNIKNAVKDRGADWKAETTSISVLSPKEQQTRLGLMPTETELQLVKQFGLDKPLEEKAQENGEKKGNPANPTSLGLPNKFDWRNVSGVNWTTSIKNQGSCGSCVAFGTIAALEAVLKRRCFNDASKSIDLSEAHLLFCGGGSCSGWHMDHACNYLQGNGVPDEACFPYSKGLTERSCATCSDWKSRIDHTKITSWSNTKDINKMKEMIVDNGPQITGMAVYKDFFSYAGGIYEHVTGDLAGYHCVCVVGYDDTNNCWICKNSWGPGWGESGWFRIKYGQCGMQDVFGMWNMVVPTAAGQGYADYILVDYSFTSTYRVLWAYAGGAWRHRKINDAQVAGIAKVAMEATRIDVWWSDGNLNFIRCWKKY